MRSVTSQKDEQKKSGKGLIIGAIALVAAGAIITCGRLSIINIPGITPAASEDNIIQVAYVTAQAAQGSPLDGIVSYMPVNLDEAAKAGDVVADDVITNTDAISGKVLRIDVCPNTTLTASMIADAFDTTYKMDETARFREVDYITLPVGLQVGDVVDVHYTEYEVGSAKGSLKRNDIVVAKKAVQAINGKTVTLELSADELTRLQAAAVEMNAINDKSRDTNYMAELTLTTYKQPTLQQAAIVTYTNSDADRINAADPNQRITDPQTVDELPKAEG